MGHTIQNLATRELKPETIFNNRFVNEVCESIHFHYRNLRILLSLPDWISMAQGCSDALNRWKKLGEKDPSKSTHIELCRKKVATEPMDENTVRVNYNKNLYPEHDGMIFSEGASFEEDKYIHVKIRDLRLEISIDDFNQIADCFAEAKEKLCQLV